jgi:tRNA (Thr-GGU) A37 N-methylase
MPTLSRFEGLIATDGTPILDIKPYICSDIKANIEVPEWE